jgi:hypothetical protein
MVNFGSVWIFKTFLNSFWFPTLLKIGEGKRVEMGYEKM